MYTEFINGKMGMHMNLSTKGIRTDIFEISAPGHELDGKSVIRQVTTPKKKGVWGKGKATFFLAQGNDITTEFHTIKQFIEHYKLPDLKEKKIEETASK